jgi:hypothetical protein
MSKEAVPSCLARCIANIPFSFTDKASHTISSRRILKDVSLGIDRVLASYGMLGLGVSCL